MNITHLNIGDTIEPSDWFEVTQALVKQFADVSGDHQWIHLDAKRCASHSPYKTTIAHGFLTASLMPTMFSQCVEINPDKHTVLNYGIDSLRYLEPVRVADKIRFNFKLVNIENKASGQLYRFKTSVDIDGRDKPALVGEFLMLLLQNP